MEQIDESLKMFVIEGPRSNVNGLSDTNHALNPMVHESGPLGKHIHHWRALILQMYVTQRWKKVLVIFVVAKLEVSYA